ncbi:MAG TPA: glycosyltransferase [Leptospiraceae bacterium]|nr:glycosyltransferase [Leptospiraceae bacterium]HRG74163.1 glycosyltransferase [Leptospiraceae bacterium]
MPRISVVIPALNEEKFLPVLLESLKNQTFKDYEVIVADAGSKDKTLEIANSYGARVVPGGMPGPGRNRGAEVATGEFLFFFDSDVLLPNDFLEKAMTEMDDRFIDLATCEFLPLSELTIDKAVFQLSNLIVKMNQNLNPRAAGFCIFINRRLFKRVGGFDESVVIAEDHDLVERASKFRPLRFLKTTSLSVSVRRLDKEGRLSLLQKYVKVEMHLLTKGSVKDDIIEYEFGNFDEAEKSKRKKLLNDIEDGILKLDRQFTKTSSEWNEKTAEVEEKLKSSFDGLNESIRNFFK